jgi:hypothetical protein
MLFAGQIFVEKVGFVHIRRFAGQIRPWKAEFVQKNSLRDKYQ